MGTQDIMGSENVTKLILKFSLPAIIGMLVNGLYNIVDRIFVGQFVGSDGLTAITVGFPFTMVILAMAMLVGIGGAAKVSILLGQKEVEAARRTMFTALVMNLVISVLLTSLSIGFIRPLLVAFGASEKVLGAAVDYYIVIFIGIIFGNTAFVLNALMRSEGSPKSAMISMLIGAGLNIVLDPIFIYTFGMGIKGAAVATILSQAVSMLWCISHYTMGRSVLKFKICKPDFRAMLPIIEIGISPFLTQIGSALINFFFITGSGKYGELTPGVGGDVAIAAIGVMNSVGMIFFMPIFGLNQGTQPLIGYNYGAKQPDRVLQILKRTILFATGFTLLGFIVMELFPGAIIRLFNNEDQALIAYASSGLRKMYLALPVVGFQIVSANFFQAIGKPAQAAFLSLSRQIIFLIPALLLLPLAFGLNGILFSVPVADLLSSLITSVFVAFEIRRLRRGILKV